MSFFSFFLFLNWGSGCGFYFSSFAIFSILEGGRGPFVYIYIYIIYIILHLKRGGGPGFIYLIFF
jgi:hypothetical protein